MNNTYIAKVYNKNANLVLINVVADSKATARAKVYKIAKASPSFDYVVSIRQAN